MIDDNTPSKLREIIMDTWPNLFWLKDIKKNSKDSKVNTNDDKHITDSTEGVV